MIYPPGCFEIEGRRQGRVAVVTMSLPAELPLPTADSLYEFRQRLKIPLGLHAGAIEVIAERAPRRRRIKPLLKFIVPRHLSLSEAVDKVKRVIDSEARVLKAQERARKANKPGLRPSTKRIPHHRTRRGRGKPLY